MMLSFYAVSGPVMVCSGPSIVLVGNEKKAKCVKCPRSHLSTVCRSSDPRNHHRNICMFPCRQTEAKSSHFAGEWCVIASLRLFCVVCQGRLCGGARLSLCHRDNGNGLDAKMWSSTAIAHDLFSINLHLHVARALLFLDLVVQTADCGGFRPFCST